VLGQRRGADLGLLAAGPLGHAGARRVAALVMLGMMVGWFGVNVGVAGVAAGRLLGMPDAAGMAAVAALALATVWRGVGTLSGAALAAGAATVVLCAWGLHLAAGAHGLTLASERTAADPAGPWVGVSLVVGYGAAFALRTPDFTRELARPRQVLWCGLAGLALPLTAFALAGAALQAATGTWDLAEVLQALASPTLAYLFVAVGFFGSIMTNIWSGALALAQAASPSPGRALGQRPAMVVVTLAGLALAVSGFRDEMLRYLVAMAILAPGLVVLCRLAWRRLTVAPPGWRVPGLTVWAASVAAGLAVEGAGWGWGAPAAATVALLGGLRIPDPVGETPSVVPGGGRSPGPGVR
ncbi:MAG TPA: hypothetical protein VNT51_02355, partial [Miltoncostaeaceae bacterium]|nr:hypothetical protein [Miltoncostaeaceae bacterium]